MATDATETSRGCPHRVLGWKRDPWIQHRDTLSQNELKDWVDGIVRVEARGPQTAKLHDVNEEANVRAVTTHVAVAVDEKTGLIGTAPVRFSFHAKHIFFDGLGLRQLIGDMFCVLGKELPGGAASVAPSCRAFPPPPVLMYQIQRPISPRRPSTVDAS